MFTEQVPQLPPRCRVTARLRDQAGHEVTGRGITPAEAARHAGISWPAAHQAFAAAADPVLDRDPAAVVHLGIDEHRRGRARFAVDEQTGEYTPARGPAAHLLVRPDPADRGCWGRCRAAPPMTPRTGWPAPRRRGGTRSRWSASACAASTRRRSAACCRAQCSPWTCSTCPVRGQGRRGRAPPGGARPVRTPRPVRRPRVRHQEPARARRGAPVT